MREGWRCPACKRINSPDLDGCPCSEGGAGVATVTPIAPIAPTTLTATWEPPPGTSITVTGSGNTGITPAWIRDAFAGDPRGGSSTCTTWQGVTFTAANAA